MPLRDHFRPPLDNLRHWGSFHATWSVSMVMLLRKKMPRSYFAEPQAHWGGSVEIDVVTYENEEESIVSSGGGATVNGGGVATAIWAPPRPTLTIASDVPAQDVYEVRIYDEKRQARLVAAVEIVSPSNKDRPENRRLFAAKCAALLQERVSVVIVDIVTTRHPNLYAELLELIGQSDPALAPEPPPLYAVACRTTKRGKEWSLETWTHTLGLGQPLPTLPLWLADNLAIPLELEESYQQSCEILNIP